MPATLVQSKDGAIGTGLSFDANPVLGNFLLGVPWCDHSSGGSVGLHDPRDSGTCPEVVSPWVTHAHFFGATSTPASSAMHSKFANETYPGPYKGTTSCGSSAARTAATLLEFSGITMVKAVLGPQDDVQNNTIDLGTFSDYGPNDAIVMAVVFKRDGGGDPNVSYSGDGFTQLVDTTSPFSNGLRWFGYKLGGSNANAKVTHSGGSNFNWGAFALHLQGPTARVWSLGIIG